MARYTRQKAWDHFWEELALPVGVGTQDQPTDAQVQLQKAIQKFYSIAPLTAQITSFEEALKAALAIGFLQARQQDNETLKDTAIRIYQSESPKSE